MTHEHGLNFFRISMLLFRLTRLSLSCQSHQPFDPPVAKVRLVVEMRADASMDHFLPWHLWLR